MSSLDIELPSGTRIRYADEKAALFFMTDVSAVGARSYDAWVMSPDNPPNALIPQDLRAINTTMRARSSPSNWTAFLTGSEVGWLRSIDPDWDLMEMSDVQWGKARERIRAALREVIGKYRKASVVTKLFHVKRPRLIPICDSLVCAAMGMSAPDTDRTVEVVGAIRDTGRANIEALNSIASRLESIGFRRSLVRILDVILWFGAPYSGQPGPYGLFEDWLVKWHGGRLFF